MHAKWFGLTLLSAVLLLPSVGWAVEVWSDAFETSPADNDNVAAGAAKIRATRKEAGDRASVEHFWGDDDDTQDDNGLHRLGSARCFYQATAPTVLMDTAADHDNTGATGGEADLDDPATNSAAGEDDDVGNGRCWIDSDDNKMYIYNGVAGAAGCPGGGLASDCWEEVVAQHDTVADFVAAGAAGVRVKAGARNLLTNGDFDFDGCDGAWTTTTPPSYWTRTTAGNTAFFNTDPTEGDGCEVVFTDTTGGLDELTQILTLQASTTYRVIARVHSDGVDTCRINTTNADTDMADTDSTSATFETVTGTFVTAGALDPVNINLISVNASDACTWDHVGVYAQEATEMPESGVVAVYDTYVTSDGADIEEAGTGYADVPELSITFVPPTEGWIVNLRANISTGCDTACAIAASLDEGVICRLEKDGNEIAGTVRSYTVETTSNSISRIIPLDHIEVNPTAGTSTTYTVACKEVGINAMIYNLQTVDGDDTESSLSMIAYPPH